MFENIDKVGVSVVIVTYNGKDRLKPTLRHLAYQIAIDFDCELLLINNNSTDGTKEFVIKEWELLGSPYKLRVVEEPKPGTMYARHRGIVNASYRYLLYCDDDNWLPNHYVKFAFDKINKNNQIAAIGGCGILEFETNFSKPNWISFYSGFFGSGSQGSQDGDTTNEKGCLYTAGAIIDRVWLNKLYVLGFTSVLNGRDGKSLVAGEDTELTIALTLIGGRLYYYSDMYFKHFMPAKRITWDYLKKLSKGIGESNYILAPYSIRKERQLVLEYIITIGLIIKYFIKSLFSGFKEGNDSVIVFNRFIGQFKALGRLKDTTYLICNNLNRFGKV